MGHFGLALGKEQAMKTIEEYEQLCLKGRSDYVSCKSCGEFKVQPENVWFDEHGYGYSTKLTRCPHCGKVVVVKYIEDYGFSNLNTDRRLYF